MAHNVIINRLIDQLIESITAKSPEENGKTFRVHKEYSQKALRNHRFGRTNQFNVQNSLDGLVEKFQVLNKDSLADALSSRLNELQTWESKLKPEVLSLLLNLADRPAEKSDVGNLDAIRVPTPLRPLTWDDIVADDPLDDGDFWKDVEYSSISSEDVESSSRSEEAFERVDQTNLPVTTGVDAGEDTGPNSLFLDEPDVSLVDSIQNGKSWTSESQDHRTNIGTEYQFVREVLNLLRGLPSFLLETHQRTGEQVLRSRLSNEHMSSEVLHSILESFKDLDSKVRDVRTYMERKHYASLLQTLSSELGRYVFDFEEFLDSIEMQIVSPVHSSVISLLHMHALVEDRVSTLLRFRDLLPGLETLSGGESYRVLDILFNQTCLYEQTLDERLYEAFARTFCACLKTYLRPIRDWMEHGETDQDDSFQLIRQNANNIDLSSFWTSRYNLAMTNDKPAAPGFLQQMVSNIYSSGRVVAFLKELGLGSRLNSIEHAKEPPLTFEYLCSGAQESGLIPFPDRLKQGLSMWIESKHYQTSSLLREHLFHDCRLLSTIDALGELYLSSNGFLFQAVASSIFSKLDSGRTTWNDPFFLEDLLSSVFGSSASLQISCLTVVPLSHISHRKGKAKPNTIRALATIAFDYAYTWPVENIIPPDSLAAYQNVFTLLLQISRAESLLSRKMLVPAKAATVAAATYSLRHRLLWLTTTLKSYILTTTINKLRREQDRAMRASNSVGEMRVAHADFISRLQRQCLLVKEVKAVLDSLLSILEICAVFTALWESFERDFTAACLKKEKEEGGGGDNDDDNDASATPLSRSAAAAAGAAIPAEAEQDSSDNDSFYEAEEHLTAEHHVAAAVAATAIAGSELAAGRPATVSVLAERYTSKIRQLHIQFRRLLVFATTGLQSASRRTTNVSSIHEQKIADGTTEIVDRNANGSSTTSTSIGANIEPAWEILAVELEWAIVDMKIR